MSFLPHTISLLSLLRPPSKRAKFWGPPLGWTLTTVTASWLDTLSCDTQREKLGVLMLEE